MSILNVNKINPVGGGSTITIAGIASVTNAVSVGNSVTAGSFVGPIEGNVTGNVTGDATGLSGNPSINTTGIVTATSFVPTVGQLSHRNKIINGAMTVSQRGTSFASASNDYHLDRFYHNGSNDGAVTISQSTTSPDGFANSYKVDVTTADTSIAASQYIQIYQRIEAQNLQDLAFGTSAAKTITVSFYVRSNLTGTYTFAMQQPDSGYRMMSQTYTIDSPNTWERKTFTVVGDTSGGINNDNGDGLNLFWNLAIGSNYTTGSSSASFITYAQTNFAAGHTANILSSTSNEFYLTGVQLEVGPVATPFEHRSFGDELRRCERYYQKKDNYPNQPYGVGNIDGANQGQLHVNLITSMRTKPTLETTGSAGDYGLRVRTTQTCTGVPVLPSLTASTDSVFLEIPRASHGFTDGQACFCVAMNSNSFLAFNAEL